MRELGQAMAEFAVAVAVLALLLLAMPVIGRYHELQMATIEGARQLAFRDSWVLQGGSYADVAAVRAALFPPPAEDGAPQVGSMGATLDVRASPGIAGQAAKTWLAPFRLAATSKFDLRDRALHGAELRVGVTSPPGLPEPFAGLQFDLSSHYELMGDAWASSGPAQVADRTSGLLVTRASLALRPLLSLGKNLLALVEPAFRELCLGQVNPELVPTDRLGPMPINEGTRPTDWKPEC